MTNDQASMTNESWRGLSPQPIVEDGTSTQRGHE